jgi:predicted dehydrogenase
VTARIGVVGCGWWATRAHLPALASNSDARIVALADPDEANRSRAAGQFGVAHHYPDVASMLAAHELDAAVIAVPHAAHAEVARACLDARLHVLLEKPMTIDPGDAWGLVARARAAGREMIVGYPWHYNPQLRAVRDALTGGRIGRIEVVSCLFASIVRELYRGDPEPYRDVLGYTLNTPGTSTYSDPAISGGGQGQTQVTHAAALLLWLTGLRPVEVVAMTEQFELGVDLADALAVRFEGGAIGALASTGSVRPGHDEILEYRLFGELGHVRVDVNEGTASFHLAEGEVERLPVLPPDQRYPEWAPARNLVAVVAGRELNGSPAELGAMTVSLVDAMYRSAREGRATSLAIPEGSRP